MSRRKHVELTILQNEVEPPLDSQHIVRALGSRGSNIIEVEFPNKRQTLCLLPAKFHKKIWIKRGNYLIIEDAPDADGKVTGEIVSVLYTNHVKQLKKVPGLWPLEFYDNNNNNTSNNYRMEDGEEAGDGGVNDGGEGETIEEEEEEEEDEVDTLAASLDRVDMKNNDNSESDSDDGLPPLELIQNRKVVVYEVSSSESESEEEGKDGRGKVI